MNAENARGALEEEAWLDLAADWMKMAESFDREDGIPRTNGRQLN